MKHYYVPEYRYRPGKGAEICDGPNIIAVVLGTSYPLGTACEADYAFAQRIADFLNGESAA